MSSKYDRIDPAEVQGLRDEIEQLKVQKEEVEKQKTEIEQASTDRQDLVETQAARVRFTSSIVLQVAPGLTELKFIY